MTRGVTLQVLDCRGPHSSAGGHALKEAEACGDPMLDGAGFLARPEAHEGAHTGAVHF